MDTDTIILLSGVLKFIPKQTIVKINGVNMSLGPRGITQTENAKQPEYTITFTEPMEKKWSVVVDRMRTGELVVWHGSEQCPKSVATMISMFV